MKPILYLLTFWLAAAPADAAPVVFARSGRTVTLPAFSPSGKIDGPVALWAFGQRMGEPATARDGKVEYAAPKVRVPVVFQLTPANDGRSVLAELVVYPDQSTITWDKNVQLAMFGEPEWFSQWAEAAGLPVRRCKSVESFDAERESSEKTMLLILGAKTAQTDPYAACRFAAERRANVLVLEAEWFGKSAAPGSRVRVTPMRMCGNLEAMSLQAWRLVIEFRAPRQPWPGAINRWTWIAGEEGLPLVERLGAINPPPSLRRPIVVSYLPWREQLGRGEADRVFCTLLFAAAKTAIPQDWRKIIFIYPKQDRLLPQKRPILFASAAARGVSKELPSSLYLFDVRGNERPPQQVTEELQSLKNQISTGGDKLLILGDDKSLDELSWLMLDREKLTAGQPGVDWLADDELPPSAKNQIRLMSTLTALGAPLGEPSQEENER